MDELQISGKRFISSRRIARENGYTSDYIGQLIRGGKIVGQKVGRAWYVDATSFDAYLGSEGADAATSPVQASVVEAEVVAAPAVVESQVEEKPDLLPEVEEGVLVSEPIVAVEKEATVEEMLADEPEELSAEVVAEIMEVPQDSAEEHVPLRIVKEEHTEKNSGGLRYVSEDAPSLPEMRSQKTASRIESTPEEREEVVEEIYTPVRMERAGRGHLAALAAAGIMIFVFSAVVSSTVSLNLEIHEGNAAATSYSLDW